MRKVYVGILERELERRRAENPGYSLRAFASFVGLNSSALSRVLNDKQELSVRAAAQLVHNLGLSPEDQEKFVVSVAQARYARLLGEMAEGAVGMSVKAALRISEERFRVLFERVDQMISLIELVRDGDGRPIDFVILRVNPAWEEQTGVKGETVVGRRVTEWLRDVGPEWLELYALVKATREPERQEYFLAGMNAWFEVYAESTDDDRLMVVGRNITARKRREAELRELERRQAEIMTYVPQILWVGEADGRVICHNPRFVDYTGVAGLNFFWTGVVHPDDRPRAIEAYQRAIADGSMLSLEHRWGAGDGSYRWFLVRAQPVRDGEGLQIFGAATDIDHLRAVPN